MVQTDIMINDYNFTKDCRDFEMKYGKGKKYALTKRQLRALIPNWMRKWRN